MADVREVYQDLLRKGLTQKEAAKEAQSQTGIALRSGRPFKRTTRSYRQLSKVGGQYERGR